MNFFSIYVASKPYASQLMIIGDNVGEKEKEICLIGNFGVFSVRFPFFKRVYLF